jgi:predicted CXXCH cytochrome family protein
MLIGLVVLVLGRPLFLPDSWGMYGRYRADSVDEHRQLPLKHGGDAACASCHTEQVELHENGAHRAVRCELCHAPVATHASGGEKLADMVIHRDAELCVRCHRELEARPEGFPQVQPRRHVEENGSEFTPAACFDCHDPHSPL